MGMTLVAVAGSMLYAVDNKSVMGNFMDRQEAEHKTHGRHRASRRSFVTALGCGLLMSTGARAAHPVPPHVATQAEQERSLAVAEMFFPGQELHDGASLLAIEAPLRAEDSAIVPVTLRTKLQADDTRRIRKITLIVEANPSPMAAIFTLGEDSGVTLLSTRVRVNDYTDIRAVAELTDGQLYTVSHYIKAAGGCSAPALTQTADAIPLGTMRFREFPVGDGSSEPGLREAQVMVRHPNFSGMQMDQVSRQYIPAEFLQVLRVFQGESEILSIESGISMSENPSFRFSFMPSDAKTFRVDAADSDGQKFSGTFPASAEGS